MLESGYVTLFRWRGAPILLHWTLPLGAVFVGGLRWAPGVWIGFFLLILFHEMGHGLLVWRSRAAVTSIRLHGLGGECHYAGAVTARRRSIIAWGGVLAQALLFAATFLLVSTRALPSHPLVLSMLDVWLEPNLVLIALNLLPIAPLDGAEAWKLFRRLRRAPRRAPKKRRPEPPPAIIDAGHVRETVSEALERAKREAREQRERQR